MEQKEEPSSKNSEEIDMNNPLGTYSLKIIGNIETIFKEKNGTPRQGILCPSSKGRLTLQFGNNPDHSLGKFQSLNSVLVGLEEYSHIWLVFVFHENNNSYLKNKVSPPRMDNQHTRVGLFATRSPYRPSPIGLSIAKIDKIDKATLYLSGVDLVHGTPILDIKPYIATYDKLPESQCPTWITEAPRPPLQSVSFTEEALSTLTQLMPVVDFYDSAEEVKKVIEEVLILDPRSTYFKKKRMDETIDNLNILCKIDSDGKAIVTGIEDWSAKWKPEKRLKK